MTFGSGPGGLPSYGTAGSSLGCSENAGSNFQFWKGRIFEVFAGVGTLSADNLTDIADYVLAKWGI
jgi:hypothetical protein